MPDEQIIDHAAAWDLAHMKRDESNLARCYIDLRRVAQDVVNELTTYRKTANMNRLRQICETNLDIQET